MNYSNYKTDDFVLDNRFVQWVTLGEDDVFWQNFLTQNPAQKAVTDKARDFIVAARHVPYPTLPPSVKAAIWSNIQEGKAADVPLRVVSRRWVGRVAAAIAVLVVVGAGWLYFSKNATPSVFMAKNDAKEVKTEYQQRKQITLPDGSIVTLNAHSNIKVSDNWDDKHIREVWLDGEAFFEVVKKTNTGAAKFVVHTPQLNIEVLGTAFNVKARRGATEVVLQSGKVRLNKTDAAFKEILMIPGERVLVSDEKPQPIVNEKVETEKITAWTNGKVIFDNTPLVDVAKAIEDHFGYQVTIADKDLTEQLYTGELLTDTPDVFFNILSKTLAINININGKKMTIKRN